MQIEELAMPERGGCVKNRVEILCLLVVLRRSMFHLV